MKRDARKLCTTYSQSYMCVCICVNVAVGEELAYALAKRGANLVLAARRTDRLTQVAKRSKELGAGEALVKFLDVADFESHVKFVQDIVDNHGAVDTLVRSAYTSQGVLFSNLYVTLYGR